MFGFFRQTPEERLYSEVWPNATTLAVFNGNPAYPKSALHASLAIAGLALASVILAAQKSQVSDGRFRAVKEMIFAALEKDEQYYNVKDILLLDSERELWHVETNSSPDAKSRIHTIFLAVVDVRIVDHQLDCRKDLGEMELRPGHMGLEFFTKRVLSQILGKPILDRENPLEPGLDDTLSVAYFNAMMTRIQKSG
jgi:hypothetical protein